MIKSEYLNVANNPRLMKIELSRPPNLTNLIWRNLSINKLLKQSNKPENNNKIIQTGSPQAQKIKEKIRSTKFLTLISLNEK